VNETRINQILALIDDARTLSHDIIEESPPPADRVYLEAGASMLNRAVLQYQKLLPETPVQETGFMCACGHHPSRHRFNPYTGKTPCECCQACDHPLTHHPSDHRQYPCLCDNLNQEKP